MKKTVLTSVFFSLLTGFLVYYWTVSGFTKNDNDIIHKSEDDICLNYKDRPVSELRASLIDTMIKSYRNNKVDRLYERVPGTKNGQRLRSDGGGFDTHSVWFDLETLKSFIYHIESNMKLSLDVANERLGVRIYYADYPKKNLWQSSNSEYHADLKGLPFEYYSRHTLIMIPTLGKKTGDENKDGVPEYLDTDIDILKPPANNQKETFEIGKYVGSKKLLPVLMPHTIFIQDREGGYTSAQNHGSMIPPANSEFQELFPN